MMQTSVGPVAGSISSQLNEPCQPSQSWQHLEIASDDEWPLLVNSTKRRVLLVAVNMPGYYSLAVRLLSLITAQDPRLAPQLDIRYVEVDNTMAMPHFAKQIAIWQPELVACTFNIWNRLQTTELSWHLKRHLPELTLLFGGQEATDSAVDFLSIIPELDYLIEGEGEIPFAQFLRAWLAGKKAQPFEPGLVSGLRYRANGGSCLTRPAEIVTSLDALPSVVLAGLVPADQRNLLGVMLEGARGCPNRCSFCFEGGRHSRVRSLSIKRLAEEAAFMAARGSSYFHIMDPILCNSNPARLRELTAVLAELQGNNPRTVISVEIYAHQVTESVADCLKYCTIVDVGLQTTHEPTARAIHRAWHPDKFQRGLALLRAAQVPFNIYLICGLPEETLSTFLQGIEAIVAEQPTRIFCNELCLLNGTELRHRAAEFGYQFDQNPPYRVWASTWMSAAELRLAQLASKVVEKRYNLTARAMYTKAPWLPKGAPQYGKKVQIALPSPCSRKCPGCSLASIEITRLPEDLPVKLEQMQDADVDIVAGNGANFEILVQLIGQMQLYAPARIRLVGPPELFQKEKWIDALVERSVWHYQSFCMEDDLEKQSAEREAKPFAALGRAYALSGFATIRPFAELILPMPSGEGQKEAEAYGRKALSLAKNGVTMLSLPAAAESRSLVWQKMLVETFFALAEQMCWLRMPAPFLEKAISSLNQAEAGKATQILAELNLTSKPTPMPPCYQG